MTVKEIMDVLGSDHEIPRLEFAELFFYLENDDGKITVLKIKNINVSDIYPDITFTFQERK